MSRSATISRKTKETAIALTLALDGPGEISINTGIGFFDHMLTAFATHARLGLTLQCDGDLHVDDHHTVEDCAIALGTALDEALAKRKGITRFGTAFAPLDEALARVVIDFSGRTAAVVNLGLQREQIGALACENIVHFFQSFAANARCALHVDVLRGDNDHHRAEAAFKAFALAVRQAVRSDGSEEIASTKGIL